MARIRDTKPGRKDGGYSRLFGHDALGALLSQIHATSIRAGTELERLIEGMANKLEDIEGFLNGALQSGTYLITKDMMKRHPVLSGSKEPDFLVVKIEENRCLIVEVKDGDAFDTKKAAGERKHLMDYQAHLSTQIPCKTSIYVCCFNQEDKAVIVEGFKGEFSSDEVMTGSEFCALLGIKKQAILRIRQSHQNDNIRYLKEQISALNL